MVKDGKKLFKHIRHILFSMDNLIKYNISLTIDNISHKFNIPKSKLNNLLNQINLPKSNETFKYNLPVYKDRLNNKYALLTNINDDFFYALLIK